MKAFSLDTTCKTPIPRWPYQAMAESILSRSYELSVRLVGTKAARAYNQNYRHKDYVPDVLAFPLDCSIGQIILTPATITKKAPSFAMTARQYTGFLFIHACLHLDGYEHGHRMERAEKKYCAQFSVPHPNDTCKK